MNVTELLGKRVLLKLGAKNYAGYIASEVSEYRVLEVSPSGVWVKLMNINGHRFWKALSDIFFLEELQDVKPPQDKS
jgi:hypothetical protein